MKNCKKWVGLCFLLPSLAGVSVFVLLPFLDVTRRSFLESISGKWVGLKNYKNILQNSAFRLAADNTIRFLCVCIPLLLFLSFFLAYFISKSGRHVRVFKSAFLMPMAIPVASVVLVWKALFHDAGLLNSLFDSLGLGTVHWMRGNLAFCVLSFSYIWKNIGYDMILWLAALDSISPDIYEAARVDGANERQCLLYMTLPNMRPAFVTISVLSFLNAMKAFREAYLVAGNYPDKNIYLLQHLYNNWFLKLSFDKMAAASVVTALAILCFFSILKKASGWRMHSL